MSHWPARSHGTSIGAACWVNDTSTWRPRGDAHRHLIQTSAGDTLLCFSDLNSVGAAAEVYSQALFFPSGFQKVPDFSATKPIPPALL